MMLMAVGMSHVMAPCTDSIMGSLPRAKAGVGSAVNDTTRQMGGAIGVAVFGSLMASHFTSSMTDKLGGLLPDGLFTQVKDNISQAFGIATRVPDAQPFRTQIVNAANDSFVSGLHIIGLVAAAITLLAAVGCRDLPAGSRLATKRTWCHRRLSSNQCLWGRPDDDQRTRSAAPRRIARAIPRSTKQSFARPVRSSPRPGTRV